MRTNDLSSRGSHAPDDRGLSHLYQQYYTSMVRLASVTVDDVEQAEEIVQDAFVSLLRSRRRPKPDREIAHLRAEVLDGAWSKRQRGMETPSVGTGEQNQLWNSFVAFPDTQAAVLILRYFEQLSEAETADVLGISERSVGSYDTALELSAALAQLFHERADRFEPRPMSYERLQAAATVPTTSRRMRAFVALALALLGAGLVTGFAFFGGGDDTGIDEAVIDEASLRGAGGDPLQAALVDDAEIEPEPAIDETLDPEDPNPSTEITVSTSTPPAEANTSPAAPLPSTPSTSTPPTPTSTPPTSVPRTPTSTPSTTGRSETTRSPNTTATPPVQRLASPSLGPLVPQFSPSVANPDGQVQLSVAWAAVPGATRYESVYSMDGVEILRPGTEGTAQRPVAIAWYQGATGRQYCLRVVAFGSNQAASEPSVVCSAEADPMRIAMNPVLQAGPNQASVLDVTWTAVGPASRYEVLTSLNGQAFEQEGFVSRPMVSIDLGNETGRFCVILHALDASGSRLQSANDCTDIG